MFFTVKIFCLFTFEEYFFPYKVYCSRIGVFTHIKSMQGPQIKIDQILLTFIFNLVCTFFSCLKKNRIAFGNIEKPLLGPQSALTLEDYEKFLGIMVIMIWTGNLTFFQDPVITGDGLQAGKLCNIDTTIPHIFLEWSILKRNLFPLGVANCRHCTNLLILQIYYTGIQQQIT